MIWTTSYINDLPDSSFLYIEPGGEKDDSGRTVPRSNRHFPVKDAEGKVDLAHLRNALARIPQSAFGAEIKASCTSRAQAMLEEMNAKSEDDEALEAIGLVGYKSSLPTSFDLDLAEEGDVRVAFAKLNVIDKDGHITRAGAFPTKEVPISAYGHTSWPQKGSRLPVGIGAISEKADEAVLEGRFLRETTDGRDTYLTVKALGKLAEWSYGYRILDAAPDKDETGRKAVGLKKLDVFEVSPTLVGAGVTRTIAIKDGSPLAGETYSEQIDRVLADVSDLVARSISLRDLRAKEGRELSAPNRERLSRLRDQIAALEEAAAELQALLERNDPEAAVGKAAVLRLRADYERIVAGLGGVVTP